MKENSVNPIALAHHALIGMVLEGQPVQVHARSQCSTVIMVKGLDNTQQASASLKDYGYGTHTILRGHYLKDHYFIGVPHPAGFSVGAA